ncbi:MAG: hypothetical protein H8D43_04975 [Chloroflexi bacterium]|nr:hypothetical protein [Chloroflexota bacterium]
MQKDASDFMIQEYDQIASAYFGLRDQVNEWFKTYLTLVGLPVTVLGVALKISNGEGPLSIADLPDVVSGPLIAVALLGFFVTLTIVSMRMEMILYARTINGIRRYFAVLDQKAKSEMGDFQLANYLILPTSDALPPFYEDWRAMFWQVVMIGILDGLILMVAVRSFFGIGWLWSAVVGGIYGLLHLGLYRLMAWRRESGWHVRFPKDLQPSEIA